MNLDVYISQPLEYLKALLDNQPYSNFVLGYEGESMPHDWIKVGSCSVDIDMSIDELASIVDDQLTAQEEQILVEYQAKTAMLKEARSVLLGLTYENGKRTNESADSGRHSSVSEEGREDTQVSGANTARFERGKAL